VTGIVVVGRCGRLVATTATTCGCHRRLGKLGRLIRFEYVEYVEGKYKNLIVDGERPIEYMFVISVVER
jgi:hypothetical protein